MTRTSCIAASVLGGVLVLAGIVAHLSGGLGIQLIAFGLLIVFGTAFDHAYRGRASSICDPQVDWIDTGEREVEAVSGEVVVVWYDRVSGARVYRPEGRSPS